MKTIIVGDVHGCRKEFAELLREVDYEQGNDDLVLVGDLLDRGPDPVGVVADAMRLGARRVRGNHEEKALRWLRYEARAAADPKFRNPMEPRPEPPPRTVQERKGGDRHLSPEAEAVREKRRLARLARGDRPEPPKPEKRPYTPPRPIPEERKAEWRALSPEQVFWLESSPLWLELKFVMATWLVVHAGFEPGLSMEEQKDDHVIRVRYVDDKGLFAPYRDGTLEQPPNSVPWMERWKNRECVVYGHAVHSREKPRVDVIDTFHPERGYLMHSATVCGIDTGCVFGGRLTAMILDTFGRYSFKSVAAEREYYPFPGIGGS